jgi:PadR family transcriptional regulator, regulatory protein AphA
MLKYVLLGFLNYQPQTGYELKQAINRSTMHFWHAELSQIYVTLKALEDEGYAASKIQPQAERPDRRVYTITRAGRAALAEWLAQPTTELGTKKELLLLKLFFSAQLDKDVLLTQLRVQRDLHQQRYHLIQSEMATEIQQSAEDFPQLAKDALLWDATRRLGELHEEAYLRWLDETIALVQKKF